jgi:hypothetical protein
MFLFHQAYIIPDLQEDATMGSALVKERLRKSQKLAADCQIRCQAAGFGNPAGATATY